MVAVVIEENNFAAELRLQPVGGLDFGHQEALREKPARLLAKADDSAVVMIKLAVVLNWRGDLFAQSIVNERRAGQ